jgi:hypothetical protein
MRRWLVYLVSIGFGLALVVVGVVGFVATGSEHLTALIPAAPGLILVGLGVLARNDNLRKHAMHGAAAVGLLTFVATAIMGWPKLIPLLRGDEVQRPAAVVSQSITAALSLVFVGLCVNSFIQARRRRRANANA